MPGEFIDDVRIFQCGQRPDGTAIMCSEITQTRIPFGTLKEDPSEDALSLGWREAGSTDIHVPLERLVAALQRFGITVSYDEAALARRIGPPHTSA